MNAGTDRRESAEMLVVDDDPRNRRLLEGYLSAAGYRVRGAPDGATALAMARQQPPDIVLVDVMMPGMTGHEVCRALKGDPATRLSQVVLVTALDGTADRVSGLDCGADDYVTKPVRREEFLAKVRSLVRARGLLLELEEARSKLAARNAELEELQALKETLTQTLVHDLKNPLTAVMGSLDLLAPQADERSLRLVGRCQASSRRMLHMILDLLDVACLEEGRLKLRREPVDAVELIHRAVEEAEVQAAPRNVRLSVRAPGDSCRVHGDASVLRRVVDNVLANALEHSPSGGTVTVEVVSRPEGLEVAVADQGAGIPKEHCEKIFEKYARLELRKAGLSANRGLGLTFCRLAVEAHGGTIWVESAPEGGALFRVLLPAGECLRGDRPALAMTA